MSYVKIRDDEKLSDNNYSNFEIEKGAKPSLRVKTTHKYDHDIMLSPAKPEGGRWPFQRRHVVHKPVTRIIDRGGEFHQSSGGIFIRKRIKRDYWRAFYAADWFHSLVDAPTGRIIALLTVCYIIMTLFFAVLYYIISLNYGCNLEIKHFVEAVAFSLQTMATIGYDTQDIFFGDCWLVATVLLFQILCGIFSDSLIIGVIYCRLSRPHARASTVLMSNNAIIRRIRGKLYLMFQLCELRKQQLSEAHVRLYVVKNEVDPEEMDDLEAAQCEKRRTTAATASPAIAATDAKSSLYQKTAETVPFTLEEAQSPSDDMRQKFIETCSMRLTHPSDERGGMLLLMVPQIVVHELDEFSPLMPPPVWYANDLSAAPSNSKQGEIRWSPPVYEHLKQGLTYDSATTEFPRSSSSNGNGNDNGDAASVAGGNGGTHSVYQNTAGLETPMKSSHYTGPNKSNSSGSGSAGGGGQNVSQDREKEMIQRYLEDRQIEIIVVVEGAAASSGGQVQARHSFLVGDIEWDKRFANCMYKDHDDGCTTIDFSLFHELIPCSKDALTAGPIASII